MRPRRHVVPAGEQRRQRHALRREVLRPRRGRAGIHGGHVRGRVRLRGGVLLCRGECNRSGSTVYDGVVLRRRLHSTDILRNGRCVGTRAAAHRAVHCAHDSVSARGMRIGYWCPVGTPSPTASHCAAGMYGTWFGASTYASSTCAGACTCAAGFFCLPASSSAAGACVRACVFVQHPRCGMAGGRASDS